MSTDAEEKSKKINSLFVNFELQFRQLLLESKSNKVNGLSNLLSYINFKVPSLSSRNNYPIYVPINNTNYAADKPFTDMMRIAKLILKTTQDKLNNCSKRNILLENQLKTECLNKSMIKMELNILTTMINKNKNMKSNNSEFDLNVSIYDREYLTNKIYKIQVENLELKQELAKSNDKVLSLMENQHKYPEKINLVTSMLNSLQLHINKLERESQSLMKILKTSKILAIKIISALEYSKKLNEALFNHFQYLMKEVANIKGQIHMFISQNEKKQITESDQENIISSNQAHLEISKKLVDILLTENYAMHKSIEQMLDKIILKNDTEST